MRVKCNKITHARSVFLMRVMQARRATEYDRHQIQQNRSVCHICRMQQPYLHAIEKHQAFFIPRNFDNNNNNNKDVFMSANNINNISMRL